MRSYKLYKHTFGREDYLCIKNEKHRTALTKFRISAHTLAIERGRYTRPPTPVENRICKQCTDKKVEDEHHFLLECTKYQTQRDILFQIVSTKCKLFETLSTENKFIYLLSAGIGVAKHVAEFIHENLP